MREQLNRKDVESPWGEFEISVGSYYTWHIGALRLWCKRVAEEVQIAFSYENAHEEKNADAIEPPEDISWSRYTLKDKHLKIRLVPSFPDRPVVVKPESLFTIAKGEQARIYVRVPLWVGIDLSVKKTVRLIEIPTVILSNTWFGTFFEGELCYWISSSARRQVESNPLRPYLAICPIQLINDSEKEFLVEKICLRTSYLTLFHDGEQLWSDETRIIHKGSDENSQIEVGRSSPVEAPSAKLISSPRNPLKKGVTAKTFASLKDLPGLGILIK